MELEEWDPKLRGMVEDGSLIPIWKDKNAFRGAWEMLVGNSWFCSNSSFLLMDNQGGSRYKVGGMSPQPLT